MTKEEFLKVVNHSRNPKYKLEDVHDGNPPESGSFIVGTENGGTYLAHFEKNGDFERWSQVCFTSVHGDWEKQEAYEVELNHKVLYYV